MEKLNDKKEASFKQLDRGRKLSAIEIASDANLQSLLNSMQYETLISSNERDNIIKARKYIETDDLLESVIKKKVKSAISPIKVYMKDPNILEKIEKINKEINIDDIINDLAYDYFSFSNMFLYWKIPTIMSHNISTIFVPDPDTISVEKTYTKNNNYYFIPDNETKNLIKTQSSKADKIPDYIKRFILKSGKIPIRKEKFEYILHKKDGKETSTGLINPRMTSIFKILKLRSMLLEGDFSVAFHIKKMILQVKTGESITSGALAGSRKNWARKADLKELKKKMATASQAISMFTNHTTDFKFHIPDLDIFSMKKWLAVDSKILRWGGISTQLFAGEGTATAGNINITGMLIDMLDFRKKVKRLLIEFYRAILNIPKSEEIDIFFTNNILEDKNELLKEVEFLVKQGLLSNNTALNVLGWNPKIEIDYKKEELKKRKLWQPTFEQSQGLLAPVANELSSANVLKATEVLQAVLKILTERSGEQNVEELNKISMQIASEVETQKDKIRNLIKNKQKLKRLENKLTAEEKRALENNVEFFEDELDRDINKEREKLSKLFKRKISNSWIIPVEDLKEVKQDLLIEDIKKGISGILSEMADGSRKITKLLFDKNKYTDNATAIQWIAENWKIDMNKIK